MFSNITIDTQKVLLVIKLSIVYISVYISSIYMLIHLGLHTYASIIVSMILTFFVHDTLYSHNNMNKESSIDNNTLFQMEEQKPVRKSFGSDIKLDDLIGLSQVKQNVSNIVNLIRVEKMRGKKAIIGHYIFQGNPGTAKTTVGRILGQTFKEKKFLKSGHFIEVTRDDLVGQYQGHTSQKTTEILNEALGGVLFIDEAYSLLNDEKDMFGLEAINTIVPFMENHRNEFVLIIAGYNKPLQKFLDANVGLKSRFDHTVNFQDYSAKELYEIFVLFAKKFHWSNSTDVYLKSLFQKMSKYKDKNFGNGREVRKVFETIKQNQSNRIVSSIGFMKRFDPTLYEIKVEDLYGIKYHGGLYG